MSQVAEDLLEIRLQRTAFALRVLEVVLEDLVYPLGLLEPGHQFPLANTVLVFRPLDGRADLPQLAFRGLRTLAGERKLFPELLRLAFGPLPMLSFPRELGSSLHEGLLDGVGLRGKQRELGGKVLLRHSWWCSALGSIPLLAALNSRGRRRAYDPAGARGRSRKPGGTQKHDVYFVALVSTMVSTALLITPSAYHRFVFRKHDREQLLETSNRLTIAGLGVLAVAISCSIFVIADFLFKRPMTITVTVFTALVFGLLWYALPLGRRAQLERRER